MGNFRGGRPSSSSRPSTPMSLHLAFSLPMAFLNPSALPKQRTIMAGPLVDGNTGMPGDVGFDPLGLASIDLNLGSATDKARSKARILRDYREAELKHGRLAMLAAVAFPLQEKINPVLSAKFRMPNLVAETGGLSPSVLNGGLEQGIIPSSIVTFAVLISLVEAQGLRIKKAQGDSWLPGDYGDIFN